MIPVPTRTKRQKGQKGQSSLQRRPKGNTISTQAARVITNRNNDPGILKTARRVGADKIGEEETTSAEDAVTDAEDQEGEAEAIDTYPCQNAPITF